MKKIQIIFILFVAITIFSCNKKSDNTPDVKKENQTTENKKSDNNTSTIKLFKMESVEEFKGEKIAPNFTWSENGVKKSINDFKGKIVFINFWATWCGPCKKEIPDLIKISEELKDKNFVMIGVNIFQQKSAPNIIEYLTVNPLPYITIDGTSELVNAYSKAAGSELSAVPTTFILNKDGKIVENIVGSRDKQTYLNIINKYLN